MKLLLLALLTFAAGMPAARANPDCTDTFRYYAADIPQRLIDAGITRFHRLQLSSLLRKLDQVTVVNASESEIAALNQNGRAGARWDRAQNTITVNCATYADSRGARVYPILALHEVLGIAGFRDNDYEASRRMWFLATSAAQRNLNASEKKKLSEKITRIAGNGGIIGVGGGGDTITLLLRTDFLEPMAENLGRTQDSAERARAWQQIEEELNSVNLHQFWPGGR